MIKAIKLMKIRNKESKILNKEENALFEEIVNKIYESSLSFYEKEIILQDILDMLVENQSLGNKVEFIVGEDYRVFCDEIIKSYFGKYQKAFSVLGYIQRTLVISIVLFLIFYGTENSVLENTQVFSTLMLSCLIGIGKFNFTREFSKYNLKNYKYKILIGAFTFSRSKEEKMALTAYIVLVIVLFGLDSIGIIKSTITIGIGVLFIILLIVLAIQVFKIALIKNYKAVN